MDRGDAAEALTTCAAFDNRTVTRIASEAWAAVLADIALADAKVAILEHYTAGKAWLMPSDIREAVKDLRVARHELAAHTDGAGIPAPPESLEGDPAGQIAWRRALNLAIGDGHDIDAADRVACRRTNATRAQIGTRDATAAIEATVRAMPNIPKAQYRPTTGAAA